jgi:ferrous iron transport protein B
MRSGGFCPGPPAPGDGPDQPIPLDLPGCREGFRADDAPLPPARRSGHSGSTGVFLHAILGPAIFLAVVVAVFQIIFTASVPLMDGVRSLVALSGEAVAGLLPDSWYRSLLLEGVWGGVGSVVAFLPQILLLFLFIGVLEDSGYLARAALIADRTMARVGLQGKSFIPLLSAYACAVPAILATRTIQNQRDRMATLLIAPFMTCSARLPVYTLLIAAFIPDRPLLGAFLGTRAATAGPVSSRLLAAILAAGVHKSTV